MNVKQLCKLALCSAILIVSKEILAFLPNVELVTFFCLMYGLFFSKRENLLITISFCFVQMILYGFGLWTLVYFVIWPGFTIFVCLIKKHITNYMRASMVSSIFGFSFGFLCSIPYFFFSIQTGWAYFLNGIFFDIIHGMGNLILCLILFDPVYKIFSQLSGFKELK